MTDTKKDSKLIRAKVGIILENPFFATLMMRKHFVADPSIKTACTDGKTIKYNPAFFDSLSTDELKGVICHELLHITLLHHTRREGRDLKRWNEATDLALNPILINSGMVLPKGALADSSYSNMSAEDIYKMLPGKEEGGEDQNKDDQGEGDQGGAGQPQPGDQPQDGQGNQPDEDNDPGGTGGVEDAPAQTQSEMAQAEAEAKQELAQAIQMAKQMGKLPAGLERLVEEILQPRIAWQEVLARFLSEVAHNDYSFSKPNPRYISSGFILPTLYNKEVGDIVLLVDTSGSIDEELLNTFAAEMQDIASNFHSTIKVIYVDSEFQGDQDIEPDDTFKLEPKGGGGTSFVPGFKWMEEQGIQPKCAVYFTDGYCSDFPEEPDFPVLWCVHGSYYSQFSPIFGETVKLD